MPGPVSQDLERLRRDYTPLFLKFLTARDEASLRSAYELGRGAVRGSLGLVDVLRVHHEAHLAVVGTLTSVAEAREVAAAAGEVLMELVAAFDMTQRGFMDVTGHRSDGVVG